MPSLTEYEIQRQKNIAANLAVLASLGLEKPAPALSKPRAVRQPKPKPKPEPRPERVVLKRKASEAISTLAEGEGEDGEGGRRKSARLTAAAAKRKTQARRKHASESDSDSSIDMPDLACSDDERGVYNDGDRPGLPRRLVNGRYVAHIDPNWTRPSPKTFGPTPNVPIGTWWAMRQEASLAGVHGPWVAGISGSPTEGAYSVALSGGYEDDIDEGFRFTFTGEGGRELKKDNLRTAPQSKDQILSKGNAALVRSYETGKPIRVIRGFKGDKKWAPKTGYRYDGLYTVMKWWEDVGMAGYKVYKFALKRVDGQEPIDLNAGPPPDSEDEKEEAEGEEEGENKENEEGEGENKENEEEEEKADPETAIIDVHSEAEADQAEQQLHSEQEKASPVKTKATGTNGRKGKGGGRPKRSGRGK